MDRKYSQLKSKNLPSGTPSITTNRYELTFNNSGGEISGHEHHRNWTVDYSGTTELINPIIDRDLFPGSPPSGLKSQTTKGGYTPGILEASIAEAAATNLLPGGQQLNALANLLSPIAAAIAALGQVGEETAPADPGGEDPPGLTLGAWIFSPIRSFNEWRRGVELDRIADERRLRESQKEMALHPGSDLGQRQLSALQQEQRRRAAKEAEVLAEGAIQFNASGFSGGFLRPGGGSASGSAKFALSWFSVNWNLSPLALASE